MENDLRTLELQLQADLDAYEAEVGPKHEQCYKEMKFLLKYALTEADKHKAEAAEKLIWPSYLYPSVPGTKPSTRKRMANKLLYSWSIFPCANYLYISTATATHAQTPVPTTTNQQQQHG